MRSDASGYWSQTLALGHDEPITAELIGRVCDFYREQGTPAATFQVAPALLPADWESICSDEGLTRIGATVELIADVETVLAGAEKLPRPARPLRVEKISAVDAPLWASMTSDVFGTLPDAISEMFVACATRPNWHVFGVWDGDRTFPGACA